MQTKLLVRMAAPIMAISTLPLAVGVVTAWGVQRSQQTASHALARNVSSLRAGEELAIDIRDVRFQLDRFLLTGDRKDLEAVPGLLKETEPWLAQARQEAVTDREQELIARVQKGHERFVAELDRLNKQLPPGADFTETVRTLSNDPLTQEMLLPAQEYLDLTEEEIARSNEDNERTADQMVRGLLLLGICWPVAGLVAGYGISRVVSHSILRLSVPIRDAAGKLNEIAGPITLSARWSLEDLEAVLQAIAEQIGAVIGRLQQSQREVLRAEQLAAVGQMAAGMAHELRNPLTSMKLLVQAAGENSHAPVLHGRDLAVLEDEITRLERLTQTFLDFARPPRPEKRTFPVHSLLEQVVELVSARAEQQGVRIRCELPAEPVVVQADMGQVRQVVLNLLLNALDAVPRGGTVWVRLVPPGPGAAAGPDGWLTLQVADTGPGLPPRLGQAIFEPFVSTKETGLGLGLSICKRIVEAHGGEITGANRPEGGACFTVRLPLAAAAAPPPPAAARP
jgi:signal transduction histidine kinase